MNVEIRKAIPEDAERIIDINIKVWNSTYKALIPKEIIDKLQYKDEERIKSKKNSIREKNNTYVILVDGKIVGFNTFGKTKLDGYQNAGEIYSEYILDEFQGLGLGRKMAIECMRELLKLGYTELITACLDGNPSNEFHKSLGGILVGQKEFEPLGIHAGIENIYYYKNLKETLELNIEKEKNLELRK